DKALLETLVRATKAHGGTIINTSRYHFGHNSPPGCTVFLMLDESHVAVHTYADQGKMAIDVFTCGNTDAQAIARQIKADLKLKEFEEQSFARF
ncbi:MAG: S-adenosylmethionine decarboxylase, partial [Candidatus Hydrogenedentota bacterium]